MIDDATVEAWMREANPIRDVDNVDAEEFARFIAAAHSRRAAAMQAPTQYPTATPIDTAPVHHRRKAWAFAAAFILVAAAVVVAAFVTRGDSEAPVADEPTAPVQVESLTWSRVPHDQALFDPTKGIDVITSITAGGPGFVAVGTTGIMDDSWIGTNAAVWFSEDGITWSRVPNDTPPLGGPINEAVQSVTVGGLGLVAVGFENELPLGGDAVVWISDDGMSWSCVPDDEAAFEGAIMFDVTAFGPGLVAVGSAAWTSPDGLTWTRVPLAPDEDARMSSVTVGGPGLVAVGSVDIETELDPDYSIAAVWTSPDGLTWSRLPYDEAVLGDADLSDVTVGGPGLVAVGSADNHAAVWTSPDGLTWTRVPYDAAVFGGGQTAGQVMNAVTSVGAQLVAVGGYGRDDSSTSDAALVWTSADGLTWTLTELDSGLSRMYKVVATSRGVIAVGQEGRAAAIWVATGD